MLRSATSRSIAHADGDAILANANNDVAAVFSNERTHGIPPALRAAKKERTKKRQPT
jgi:hypothetical protein